MAATGTARIQVSLDPISPGAATDELLAAILRANPRVSDLIFSPARNIDSSRWRVRRVRDAGNAAAHCG